MKDIRGNTLYIGMRVMLTNPSEAYTLDDSNPLDIPGTYKGRGNVLWDNGKTNGYMSNELTIIPRAKKRLTSAGSYESIWETV